METVFIFFVVVLFLLAFSDLIVGVSNDAVNFLNSAIGSKAAPFWAIMIVASLGIIVGATFSSGMMEVARKGIFHPQNFLFSEIMIVFLAVMITDVLLLDLFNTFGLPTSTTVSIVFELLGAAVAVALIKTTGTTEHGSVGDYINSGSALKIISGILLSIVVAFTSGALIQYVTRLIFSFNYEKPFKYFGAIWGGIAITAITYFILIKGAKGSALISKEALVWIKSNTLLIIGISLSFWTVVFYLIRMLTKINILKVIILIGTFALAMAFAGNDLVNFIGVPLAGLKSYEAFDGSGLEATQYTMEILSTKVPTPTIYLLLAGLVMVVTLWFSRKAKSVTETEINLARQDEGQERFGSSLFSRSIVRGFIQINNTISKIVPQSVQGKVSKRFEKVKEHKSNHQQKSHFDLIRASVNLTVASILISFATSLKLPLSTTYVTFMVAMGTSLADGAWGRESAVYRISGVVSVIGGWFFTAFMAFIAAFTFAYIINWGYQYSVILLLIIAVVLLIRAQKVHRKREKVKAERAELTQLELESKEENVVENCISKITNTVESITEIYKLTIDGLAKENRKTLRKAIKKHEMNLSDIKSIKNNIKSTLLLFKGQEIETGHYYIQVIDYLEELVHSIGLIISPAFAHIDNNHMSLGSRDIDELNVLNKELEKFLSFIINIIKKHSYNKFDESLQKQQSLLKKIYSFRKTLLKRIKNDETKKIKNALLYLDILNESKNLAMHAIYLLKSQRDFVLMNTADDESTNPIDISSLN